MAYFSRANTTPLRPSFWYSSNSQRPIPHPRVFPIWVSPLAWNQEWCNTGSTHLRLNKVWWIRGAAGVTASFPLVAEAIGLSSMLRTGSPSSPYIDRRWLSLPFNSRLHHASRPSISERNGSGPQWRTFSQMFSNSDSKTRTYDLSFRWLMATEWTILHLYFN